LNFSLPVPDFATPGVSLEKQKKQVIELILKDRCNPERMCLEKTSLSLEKSAASLIEFDEKSKETGRNDTLQYFVSQALMKSKAIHWIAATCGLISAVAGPDAPGWPVCRRHPSGNLWM
jgi:hypothetical protein